jgi:hypothetical protein
MPFRPAPQNVAGIASETVQPDSSKIDVGQGDHSCAAMMHCLTQAMPRGGASDRLLKLPIVRRHLTASIFSGFGYQNWAETPVITDSDWPPPQHHGWEPKNAVNDAGCATKANRTRTSRP